MIAAAIEPSLRLPATPDFRGHIPELDALRAFGLTMVILAHMWPRDNHQIWSLIQLAWSLMDSFFVLSGFLITGILLDSRSRPDYYRSFYTRRALRILPVYYLLITVLLGGSLLGEGYRETSRTWGSPWWFFVYLGNIPTALTGVWPQAARGSFIPLWSLQIEEQFYLLFPLLVHRLQMKTLLRVLLGLACLSPILRIVIYWLDPANTPVQYVFLPCRMEGFALGAWIAIRFRQKPWHIPKGRLTLMTIVWVTVTGLSGAWGGYEHIRPFNRTLGFLISPIAWAHVVLWLIVFRGSRLTACLRLAPVQHVGKVSYGGYLFHWPIAAVVTAVSAALGIKALGQGHTKVIVVYALTLIGASLSWRFFESPILRLKDRLSGAAIRHSGADSPGCKELRQHT